jgi:hypothetical protein
MSQSTNSSHGRYQSSGNTTEEKTLTLESRHHLKKTHQKILTNIKDRREELEVMAAKDIRQHDDYLDEATRKSKVAVEKMTHAITVFYDDRVEDLYKRRKHAYDALEKTDWNEYKFKHFFVTVRYGVGPRVWWMNQRKDAKIQQLQDAVDKLHMSRFMARLTDG